jgi:hypothetical protein
MAQIDPFFSTLDHPRFEEVIFDGFPYLIVHPALGINHIILLPRGLSYYTLQWIAYQQFWANRLPVSLVMAADSSIVHLPEGGLVKAFKMLFPGFPVAGSIRSCVRFSKGGELCERASSLEKFIADHPITGFRFGNPWKEGRPATIDESVWLSGRDADGVPRGLQRCPTCGDWKGECLDFHLQKSLDEDVVVPVACSCENWNRCARCHRTLERRRLNSNFFDPEERKIYFVPGVCALDHRC